MASSSSPSIRSVSHRNLRRSFLHEYNHRNQNARPPSSLMMPNRTESATGKGRIISMATSAKTTHFNKLQARDHGIGAKISGENLDQWMRESVVDIVKNLRQAPLLVQVYEETEKGGAATRLETEKAVKEKWAMVKSRWERGESPLPQGVIFVEELGEEERERESNTKAWGIVVQGRGAECGPVCYLLKTSRVKGLGSTCCTHFCLAKVKGFRETTESQLKNCWLVQPAFSSTNS
ncbi:uncharacterized protein LOC121251550 [Juglans microcarpa x Juglans regia]|uniref:uncharacterized protein LOC121251550 n=1 Tax=Juglans microcarpa x Juglans regia TaxID=2249226 RepID=UPI001B7EB46F|nr:uncharacterized protein LOC121251550 [Juglans microcarpa x Juglans regia]